MMSAKDVSRYLRISRAHASKLMHRLGFFREGNQIFIKRQTLKEYLVGLNPGVEINL